MRHALHLFFLLPVFAQAQEPSIPPLKDPTFHGPAYFENAKDSTAFMQFSSGLKPVELAATADTTTFAYHLAWVLNERGGMVMVRRGDGGILKASERVDFFHFERVSVPHRTADGRRVILMMYEEPCALLCRTTYYYVEE